MAEEKIQTMEREYIIPLRKEWRKVANYKRTGRAIKEIKKYIAKHMKVPDRDTSKIKIDIYLNNEIWFRGRRKPPAKIKVRAIKEKDIIRVELAEIPEYVKFKKQKDEKFHKSVEVKPKEEKKTEEKKEDEEVKKKAEQEKEQSVAEQHALEAKQEARAEKHIPKLDKKKTQPTRMSLKK
ncbi:MAG: 50S ribosomal protein L31e [Nanoarchaeota archaeon]|nr:50S ribosomal protein L31e [Nanoarchaeota archaeon]